jgi:excisionase family DNA binding protein
VTIVAEMTRERHLTPAELAEREGVSVTTIYEWNMKGVGPKRLKIGKHIRFRLSDVEAWERSREVDRE